jgi:hypothetical protein
VGYELRALVAQAEAITAAARKTTGRPVALPQGLALLPVTDQMFDHLGEGEARPFGPSFGVLSGGVDRLAREVSHAAAVAYLEADLHGGTGDQAVVVWQAGTVILGPVRTEFGWPPESDPPRSEWAFNTALRQLGVDMGSDLDEFKAVDLGRHRHTDDWVQIGS